ncbi:MAG: hypothetical protein RLZZ326_4278 [Planctomycetota bacterium]|jgi:hypothetical protein
MHLLNVALAFLLSMRPPSGSKVKARTQRLVPAEDLEGRRLCAVDTAATFDTIRDTTTFRRAERQAMSTHADVRLQVDVRINNSNSEHQFLRKLSGNGVAHADCLIHWERDGTLTESATIREAYSGRSRLDDLESVSYKATGQLQVKYTVSSGRVRGTDWRSEEKVDVEVQKGPAKGVSYSVNALAVDNRAEYSDKISGLSPEELVSSVVRNATAPVSTTVGAVLGDRLTQLERIPGTERIWDKIGGYKLVIDALAGPAGRTDTQIYNDAVGAGWQILCADQASLTRFAEGAVQNIVATKPLALSFEWETEHIPVTGRVGATYFGLVTVDGFVEAWGTASVGLNAVLVADSRGIAVSEGSVASVAVRVTAEAVGWAAVVGAERFSLLASKTTAGVFVEVGVSATVGQSGTKADHVVNGRLLYLTEVAAQRSKLSDYFSVDVTAKGGVKVKETVYTFGVKVGQKSWTWDKELVHWHVISPSAQLGA